MQISDVSHLEAGSHEIKELGSATCSTPIWNNGLMWSHYADSHAGYCVEYCVMGKDAGAATRGCSKSVFPYRSLPRFISRSAVLPHPTLGRTRPVKFGMSLRVGMAPCASGEEGKLRRHADGHQFLRPNRRAQGSTKAGSEADQESGGAQGCQRIGSGVAGMDDGVVAMTRHNIQPSQLVSRLLLGLNSSLLWWRPVDHGRSEAHG